MWLYYKFWRDSVGSSCVLDSSRAISCYLDGVFGWGPQEDASKMAHKNNKKMKRSGDGSVELLLFSGSTSPPASFGGMVCFYLKRHTQGG